MTNWSGKGLVLSPEATGAAGERDHLMAARRLPASSAALRPALAHLTGRPLRRRGASISATERSRLSDERVVAGDVAAGADE